MLLLATTAACPATDLSSTLHGPQLPPAFRLLPAAVPLFVVDRLILRGQSLRRDLDAIDGSDAAPLVLSVRLAPLSPQWSAGSASAGLFLVFADEQAVGIGPDVASIAFPARLSLSPGAKREPDAFIPQVLATAWTAQGKTQQATNPAFLRSRLGLPGPCWYRLVVTGRSIQAFASESGIHYVPVASWPRRGALATPPRALVLGLLTPSDQSPRFDPAKPDGLLVEHLRQLVAQSATPAATDLLREATPEQTLRVVDGEPLIHGWTIQGPMPMPMADALLASWAAGSATPPRADQDSSVGSGSSSGSASTAPRTYAEPSDWDGRLALNEETRGQHAVDSSMLATAVLRCDDPRGEDCWLAYDGFAVLELFHDGRRLTPAMPGSHNQNWDDLRRLPHPGLHAVLLPLRPGDNHLTVRLSSRRFVTRLAVFSRRSGNDARRLAIIDQLLQDAPDLASRCVLLRERAAAHERSGDLPAAAATWHALALAAQPAESVNQPAQGGLRTLLPHRIAAWRAVLRLALNDDDATTAAIARQQLRLLGSDADLLRLDPALAAWCAELANPSSADPSAERQRLLALHAQDPGLAVAGLSGLLSQRLACADALVLCEDLARAAAARGDVDGELALLRLALRLAPGGTDRSLLRNRIDRFQNRVLPAPVVDTSANLVERFAAIDRLLAEPVVPGGDPAQSPHAEALRLLRGVLSDCTPPGALPTRAEPMIAIAPISDRAETLLPDAPGALRYAAGGAAARERLRSLGATGRAIARVLWTDTAATEFAEQSAQSDADLLALASRHPSTPTAAAILLRLAASAHDQGQADACTDHLTRLLRDFDAIDHGADPRLLLAWLARSAIHAGNRSIADAALRDLAAADPLPLIIAGVSATPAQHAATLRRQLALLDDPQHQAQTAIAIGAAASAATVFVPLRDLDRREPAGPGKDEQRLIALHPIADREGTRYVVSGRRLLAIAASGALCFQVAALQLAASPQLPANAKNMHNDTPFPAIAMPGAADPPPVIAEDHDLVIARLQCRTGGALPGWTIAAYHRRTGALRWSTAHDGDPALVGHEPASAPSLAAGVVLVSLRSGRMHALASVAALDLATGRVRWRSPVISGVHTIATADEAYRLEGPIAAPLAADGMVYAATNFGAVAALDLADGSLRWTAAYPRALFTQAFGAHGHRLIRRFPAPLLVHGDRLIVAPNDAVDLRCLRRSDGALLWQRPGTDLLTLVGVQTAVDVADVTAASATGGARTTSYLIVEDHGIAAHRLDDGALAWRWSPDRQAPLPQQSGATWSGAVLDGGDVLIGCERGLLRLRDGVVATLISWNDLGAETAVGSLHMDAQRRLSGLTPTGSSGTAQLWIGRAQLRAGAP